MAKGAFSRVENSRYKRDDVRATQYRRTHCANCRTPKVTKVLAKLSNGVVDYELGFCAKHEPGYGHLCDCCDLYLRDLETGQSKRVTLARQARKEG